jgi:hypothetical protein
MTEPEDIAEMFRKARISDTLKQKYVILTAQARATLSDIEFEEVLQKIREKISKKEKELN